MEPDITILFPELTGRIREYISRAEGIAGQLAELATGAEASLDVQGDISETRDFVAQSRESLSDLELQYRRSEAVVAGTAAGPAWTPEETAWHLYHTYADVVHDFVELLFMELKHRIRVLEAAQHKAKEGLIKAYDIEQAMIPAVSDLAEIQGGQAKLRERFVPKEKKLDDGFLKDYCKLVVILANELRAIEQEMDGRADWARTVPPLAGASVAKHLRQQMEDFADLGKHRFLADDTFFNLSAITYAGPGPTTYRGDDTTYTGTRCLQDGVPARAPAMPDTAVEDRHSKECMKLAEDLAGLIEEQRHAGLDLGRAREELSQKTELLEAENKNIGSLKGVRTMLYFKRGVCITIGLGSALATVIVVGVGGVIGTALVHFTGELTAAVAEKVVTHKIEEVTFEKAIDLVERAIMGAEGRASRFEAIVRDATDRASAAQRKLENISAAREKKWQALQQCYDCDAIVPNALMEAGDNRYNASQAAWDAYNAGTAESRRMVLQRLEEIEYLLAGESFRFNDLQEAKKEEQRARDEADKKKDVALKVYSDELDKIMARFSHLSSLGRSGSPESEGAKNVYWEFRLKAMQASQKALDITRDLKAERSKLPRGGEVLVYAGVVAAYPGLSDDIKRKIIEKSNKPDSQGRTIDNAIYDLYRHLRDHLQEIYGDWSQAKRALTEAEKASDLVARRYNESVQGLKGVRERAESLQTKAGQKREQLEARNQAVYEAAVARARERATKCREQLRQGR